MAFATQFPCSYSKCTVLVMEQTDLGARVEVIADKAECFPL